MTKSRKSVKIAGVIVLLSNQTEEISFIYERSVKPRTKLVGFLPNLTQPTSVVGCGGGIHEIPTVI